MLRWKRDHIASVQGEVSGARVGMMCNFMLPDHILALLDGGPPYTT